jgi:putative ABC transport system permease protein
MNSSLSAIPVLKLLLAFGPVLIVVGVLYRWSVNGGTALYALARMVVQLVLVGYVLVFIFQSDRASIVLGVLAVMLLAASWISMRPLRKNSRASYMRALGSICTGGVLTLIVVTQGVLDLEPWYEPRFVIPLAGMIFATSMNTVSLAAERFDAEMRRGSSYDASRDIALRAALIPMFNSLLAVGLVSFPGMMTGQILSGVEPLIAIRYQIMVMCMIFGAAGISAACYLVVRRNEKTSQETARTTEQHL